MNSAGFSPSSPPVAGANFSVFGTAGTFDFNYGEVVELDAKLATFHYTHTFRRFDGPHGWAPASVMDEALAWFRLIAMKQGREDHDVSFVKDQAAEAEKRAKALEAAGDMYASWKDYRQDADTFDDLGDATAFRERAAAMEKEKGVRDGAKREQQDFAEQARLVRIFLQGWPLCVRKARAPTCAAKSSGKSPTCAIARNMRRTRKSSASSGVRWAAFSSKLWRPDKSVLTSKTFRTRALILNWRLVRTLTPYGGCAK